VSWALSQHVFTTLINICEDGTSRVKKLVCVSSSVPTLLKTDQSPDGVDIGVIDGFRAAMLKDRAQFFRDVPSGPFFGFNRPQAKVSQGLIDGWFQAGMQAGLKASHDTTFAWQIWYGDDLKNLDIPVHFIQGDDDQIVPIKTGALLGIKLAKKGHLKVYKGQSHALPRLNADELNQDLLEILKTDS